MTWLQILNTTLIKVSIEVDEEDKNLEHETVVPGDEEGHREEKEDKDDDDSGEPFATMRLIRWPWKLGKLTILLI